MSERRLDRQRLQRRLLLERTMERALAEGIEALEPLVLAREAGLSLRRLGAMEDLFFPEHAETLELLGGMLERVGLLETCLALARHREEDRDHWLRRLAFIETQPRLRAHRELLERDYLACYAGHFQRWGADERGAAYEAGSLLGALREAERLWVAGNGRPMLPVLVHEALSFLWPALYPHVRRHGRS